MKELSFSRVPKHIGIIPDGNRRWAENMGFSKEMGYKYGIDPGIKLYEACLQLGIKEITFYGFTQDNTKRPTLQRIAFQKACIDAVKSLEGRDAELLVVGNTRSSMFPKELIPYTQKVNFGSGKIRINFLVNYSWQWDLCQALGLREDKRKNKLLEGIGSKDISRVDLIIRWGGRRRLSGFLPVQSIYSDFYIVKEFWPDFKKQHLYDALEWYGYQDITLGG